MAKIIHHGAVKGVTGSCHQLFLDKDHSVLIDCGMFQGAEASDLEQGSLAINFPLSNVVGLIVTHCHIDHVGRIPYLLAAGFDKPIYVTEATAQLLPLVIEDAIKVGISRDAELIDKVLGRLKSLLRPFPYDEWFSFLNDEAEMACRFRMAGHILGSAYVEFKLPNERVTFSGDLGAPYSPLLAAPKSPYRTDCLVIESTYGDKNHQGRKDRRLELKRVLERCLSNAGTVLIPAFSIGRTQELLYEIEEIIYKGSTDWKNLDVIVDSPLAAEFTKHYRSLKELWDKEARRKVSQGRHPLAFEQLITIDSHDDHQRLVNHLKQSGRPAIVIAASGMCAGGRIVNYLRALLGDPKTDVLFVGYQAQGTAGRDIQKYGPRGGYVYLDEDKIDIKAGVYTISGYSAHADQKDLVNFVKRMRVKPKEIRIVHGDDQAKLALKDKLLAVVPDSKVWIP
ncbi:MBL fold metallo-hydrolase RNA specificity domain-containing protein [Neptuniibacter sp. QD34_54]|uniref:MBL fold metallo-hydrolase RNA specificity domain-containing protein n=1 Tax=Neptuniibacter sp. QD34_54 TaxID=3398208 RepID=UPI0039F554A9